MPRRNRRPRSVAAQVGQALLGDEPDGKQPRATPVQREHGMQVAVMQMVGWMQNRWRPLQLLYAIPNGGYRPWSTGFDLRAEGLKDGMPDLHLPVARQVDGCDWVGFYHSLYLELKVHPNTVAKNQAEIHDELRAEGNAVRVCWTVRETIETLCLYLSIPRELWPETYEE